jgi:hypothetical protein
VTRQEAVKRLEKLYGKGKAYYRIFAAITSPETRAAARAEIHTLTCKRDALDDEVQAWLNEQPFYQQKNAERKHIVGELRKAERSGLAHAYRFTIGKSIGWANEITGEGDTWEEAFRQAESKSETKAS